jgi:predicted transcriptional regulator
MTNTKSSGQSPPIGELRKLLPQLAAYQAELRQNLITYRQSSGLTQGAIAKRLEIGWNAVAELEAGTSVISSGKRLDGLCELMSCQELGVKIKQLAQSISSRYMGFVLGSEEAVNLALDIVEASQESDAPYAAFVAAFGDHHEIAEDALAQSNRCIRALEDPTTAKAVRGILQGDFEAKLKRAQAAEQAKRTQAATKLSKLVEKLTPQYGELALLAKQLDVHRTTFHYARNGTGRISLATIEELTRKCEHLLAEQAAEQPAPDAVLLGGSPLPNELAVVSGATTDEGVRFVLTEDSFKEVGQIPVIAARESLKTTLECARLLLNSVSQLSDKTLRDLLREELGPEVEELQTAINLFTFAQPQRLLDQYDAQRSTRQGKVPPSTRPRRRT